MSAAAIVALMLRLLPSGRPEQLRPFADAISSAASSREDAVVLTVVSYYEDTFGRGHIPFGACSFLCPHGCHDCRHDVAVVEVARWSLRLLQRTATVCGHDVSWSVRLGWYHTGHCRADAFTVREAASVATLLSHAE